MSINLPENFRPSEKFKVGIKNCAYILNNVDIETIKELEHDINEIGPDPEALSVWVTDNLTDKERFILVTAALAAFYTEIELRKK